MTHLDTAKATALYAQFKNMLYARSWEHARKYSLPFEDFLSEAHVIFCNAIMSYDPTKSSFSGYLYGRLDALSHMADNREYPWQSRTLNDSWISLRATVQDGVPVVGWDSVLPSSSSHAVIVEAEMSEYVCAMSPDAQQLYDWQQYGDLNPPETAKAKVKPLTAWSVFQRKTKQVGWTWQRTQQAFNELRMVMDNYRFARDIELVD